MMVGNSLRSDVVPAIAAGSWGIYVPHELNWVVEHDDPPADSVRYREIVDLAELPGIVKSLGKVPACSRNVLAMVALSGLG